MQKIQFTTGVTHVFKKRQPFCTGIAKQFAALPMNLSDSTCLIRTIKDIKFGYEDVFELETTIRRFTEAMNTSEKHLHEMRANRIGVLQHV